VESASATLDARPKAKRLNRAIAFPLASAVNNPEQVFGLFKPKNPEEHRYYLLPGMGRSNRRQRQLYFRCAIVFGLFVAAIVGVLIYLSQRPGPSIFR
jgi:hypothetical protein